MIMSSILHYPVALLLAVTTLTTVSKTVLANDSTMRKPEAILNELHEQFEKTIQVLLGTDTRLIRVDITTHTDKKQIEFCPSALPIAINTILTYASPTSFEEKKVYNDIEIKTLGSAMELCILCITNNPSNRAIFSEGRNIEQSYTIHSSIVSLLSFVPELTAKAAHLVWIATFANPKNHFHFIQADVINVLMKVINDIPYPITTDNNNIPSAITVMWAAAALQNLAASYCDGSEDGTCEWDWFKHDHEDGNVEYVFALTEESGKLSVDASEVRQVIASNPSLIHRLLQWTCHGPVSGSMSFDNPFPGRNAIAIHEHETSMNVVPWATLGALSNIAIDKSVKAQLLYHYGETMPCFCYMSQSPDWLEAVKGQSILHHLRYDKNPCWFDFHESGEQKSEEHVLCVDRLFTDIAGNTCEEYSDAESLLEEDCNTPDIEDETILASSTCCLCNGGDHYPKSQPVNLLEPELEHIQSLLDASENEINEQFSEHEEDYEGEEFDEVDGEQFEEESEDEAEEEL